MNAEIKYTGLSSVPSDRDAQDGELTLALNVINEDGCLRPIRSPLVELSIPNGVTLLAIHESHTFKHYICIKDGVLTWADNAENVNEYIDPAHYQTITTNVTYANPRIAIMGNTLIVIEANKPITYILWKDGVYNVLGSQFPEINIDFSIAGTKTKNQNDVKVTLKEMRIVSDEILFGANPDNSCLLKNFTRGGEDGFGLATTTTEYTEQFEQTNAGYATISSHLYDGINKLNEKIREENGFWEPFFIRYAFRLFDGQHIMQSAPILMVPNTGAPVASHLHSTAGKIRISTSTLYGAIAYRNTFDVAKLQKWKDIITHIDFFITKPVKTYDSAKTLPVKVNQSNLDLFPRYSYIDDRGLMQNGAFAITKSEEKFEQYQQQSNLIRWNIQSRKEEDMKKDLTESTSFYHIAEIAIDDKLTSGSEFRFLPLFKNALVNIEQRQTLVDDYHTHRKLMASEPYIYNSRINLCGISYEPFGGFPIRTQSRTFDVAGSPHKCNAYVRINSELGSIWVTHPVNDSLQTSGLLPRFLSYPDARAEQMVIEDVTKGKAYSIKLTAHPFLNCAYYFAGFQQERTEQVITQSELSDIKSRAQLKHIIPQDSKLYTSEVANPYLFLSKNINTIGHGKVLTIRSAVQALSQGQFGQFPLYAFTTEGIWTLSVSDSTGGFSIIQPVAYDVCLSTDSIAQLSNSVAFVSSRGAMTLQGSDANCISESLMADSSPMLDYNVADHLKQIINEVGADLIIDRVDELSTKQYILGSHIIFDYANQRLWFFRPDSPFTYVLSLKTNMWSISSLGFKRQIASYPEARVVDKYNRLVNLSIQDGGAGRMAIMTRPIKVDSSDSFKTISCVIQRGQFYSNSLQTAIYGSNDLRNWFVVWDSYNHILRGFRGSPWKYYKVAVIGELGFEEFISGMSLDYTSKLNNRMR